MTTNHIFIILISNPNLPIELKLGTEEEKKEFYKLRSEENKSLNYEYPQINYTTSPSDLINPELN